MRRQPMREFFAPLPLLAVAVMGVNDAYLKAHFHNAITGKLSDIAGCFFLPLFASALLSLVPVLSAKVRLGLGAVATISFFTAIKLSQPAADAACGAMNAVGTHLGTSCGRILAEPADLFALPFALLAVLYGLTRTGAFQLAAEPTTGVTS